MATETPVTPMSVNGSMERRELGLYTRRWRDAVAAAEVEGFEGRRSDAAAITDPGDRLVMVTQLLGTSRAWGATWNKK